MERFDLGNIFQGISTLLQSDPAIMYTRIGLILLGILLLCTPSMLFTILPFVLGFWLLFRGFMAVGVASEMMGVGIKGAGWTMTLGILVIISAFLVLFNPIIGVGVVVFWVGLSLLLAGVDLIAHAVTLRRLRKEL